MKKFFLFSILLILVAFNNLAMAKNSSKNIYDYRGQLLYIEDFKYNLLGQVEKQTTKDTEGNVLFTISYLYNNDGNTVITIEKGESKFVKTFNKRGDITKSYILHPFSKMYKSLSEYKYTYNTDNKIIKQIVESSDYHSGQPLPDTLKYETYYDENGNIIKTIKIHNGITTLQIEFLYDSNGNNYKEIYTSLNSEGIYENKTISYIYDNNKLIEKITKDKDNNIKKWTRDDDGEYKYNEKGDVISIIQGKNDSKMYYYYDYIYDKIGKIVKKTEWRSATGEKSKYPQRVIIYDTRGNIIKEKSLFFDTNNEREIIHYYIHKDIEYDKYNNKIKEKFYSEMNEEYEIYQYIYEYDKEGKITKEICMRFAEPYYTNGENKTYSFGFWEKIHFGNEMIDVF